jgi:hypothetical protein
VRPNMFSSQIRGGRLGAEFFLLGYSAALINLPCFMAPVSYGARAINQVRDAVSWTLPFPANKPLPHYFRFWADPNYTMGPSLCWLVGLAFCLITGA